MKNTTKPEDESTDQKG